MGEDLDIKGVISKGAAVVVTVVLVVAAISYIRPPSSDGDEAPREYPFDATLIRISTAFDSPSSTTAGIQEALDDLPAGGGLVFIPAGNHSISTTITVHRSNVIITGSGASTVITTGSLSGDFIYFNGKDNVSIQNLNIDGTNQVAGDGIKADGDSTGCRYSNIGFHGIFGEDVVGDLLHGAEVSGINIPGKFVVNGDGEIAKSRVIQEVRISRDFDDGTSVTAGIQEAIDDLPAAGGVVYVPAGTHTLSSPGAQNGSTIAIPDNVVLMGAGREVTTIELGPAFDGHVMWNDDIVNGNRGITVRDITFDCANIADLANDGLGTRNSCIAFGGDMSEVTVRDCRFTGPSYADVGLYEPSVAGSEGVRVRNNIFDGTQRGVHLDQTTVMAREVLIDGNIAHGSAKGLAAVQLHSDCVITNNEGRDCGAAGLEVVAVENCAINNNAFYSCGGPGMRLVVGDVCTVVGNACSYNGADGILATGNDFVMVGNTGADNGGAGIYFMGDKDVTITGNTFEDCTGPGIQVGDVNGGAPTRRATITGNNITNCEHGIAFYASDGSADVEVVISSNRCSQNVNDGIHVGNDATTTGTVGEVVIANNVCSNDNELRQEYGVYIDDNVSDVLVTGNVLLDNVTAPMRVPTGGAVEYTRQHVDHFQDVQVETDDYLDERGGTGARQVIVEADFTGSQLDVPRNVKVTCTDNADPSGDVVIDGIDARGRTAQERLTIDPGGTVVGNVAFARVTQITIPAGVMAGDTVSVGNGSKLGLSNPIDGTADVYKVRRNAGDHSGDGSVTVDAAYNTVDVSAGGAIGAGDDFTVYYRVNLNVVG